MGNFKYLTAFMFCLRGVLMYRLQKASQTYRTGAGTTELMITCGLFSELSNIGPLSRLSAMFFSDFDISDKKQVDLIFVNLNIKAKTGI